MVTAASNLALDFAHINRRLNVFIPRPSINILNSGLITSLTTLADMTNDEMGIVV